MSLAGASFSKGPFAPVGFVAIASATSRPAVTFPNTV